MNHFHRVAAFAALGFALTTARAVMIHEIQVYTDDINAPAKFGHELHLNLTLSGRRVPDYTGEITPHRAFLGGNCCGIARSWGWYSASFFRTTLTTCL